MKYENVMKEKQYICNIFLMAHNLSNEDLSTGAKLSENQ